ncbi:hypothetical protein L0F63_001783 [Massospora cicadina]|nr:hypothetical protein L0F63_001783 [Massospora cicadina]
MISIQSERKDLIVGQPSYAYNHLFTEIFNYWLPVNQVDSSNPNLESNRANLPLQPTPLELRKTKAELAGYLACIKFHTDVLFDQAMETIEADKTKTRDLNQPLFAYDSAGQKVHHINRQYGLHTIQSSLDPEAKILAYGMEHLFQIISLFY